MNTKNEVITGLRTRLLLACSLLFALFHAGMLMGSGSASAQQFVIEAGPLASFEITAPSMARVGEKLAIRITAKDASGNVIRNYDKSGSEVKLNAGAGSGSTGSVVDPGRFASSAFREGVLDASVTLMRSGSYELVAEDQAARVASRTGRIDVRPGDVSMIKVLPPQEARVGEGFDVAVELYDRYANAIIDYDRHGGEVRIKQGLAGSIGRFEPSTVSPSLFSQGRATIRLRYSQAENAVILIEAGTARGVSSPVNVRAGDLDRFIVTVPSRTRAIAGEQFSIIVEARDAGGNTITDFNRVGGVVTLRTTGSGNIEPSSIPPTAFSSGIAMVNVRYNVAEKIGVIAEDQTGAKRGESSEKVEVSGGKLGRIEIVPAENAQAGAPLAIQILGYDIYGNFIRDYSNRAMRIVVTAADASPFEAPVVTASSFRAGVAILSGTPVKAGMLVIQCVDEVTGAGGRSGQVKVRAGVAASYAIRAPLAAVAHEAFEVAITALDRFGNVVDDYSRVGSGVMIDRPGLGEISPASIPPSAFIDGVARVNITYNTAEEITLTMTEQGGTARGRSTPLVVTHSAPKRFLVKTGTHAAAGEPFRITLTAVDDFGNPVATYSAMNRTVTLYMENGDPVAPPVFASAAFRRGVAEIDAVFFRTGEAVLVAEELGGVVSGKSGIVRILPGRPSQLLVTTPTSVEAGGALPIRIEVKDKLGNRIRDYSPAATSLSVKVVSPNGAMMPDQVALGNISRMVFQEGVAILNVLPRSVGDVVFEIGDEMMNMTGRSQTVTVTSGPVDKFKVESLTSGTLRAGEPLRLRITALDAFGNLVSRYGKDGSGARLTAQIRSATGMVPASGVFVPSTLSGAAFVNGSAEIHALYDRAEAVEVVVDRIASGATVRPEVVAATAAERSGGTLISVIGNAPLSLGEARRLTESLLELVIPGAILSTKGTGVARQSGIVSLVTLSQTDEGVRVLIHAMGAAVMRAGLDANRVVIDVDPVIAGVSSRSPALIPANATMSGQIQPTVPLLPAGQLAVPVLPNSNSTMTPPSTQAPDLSRMAEVDRLLRANRFSDALAVVDAMIAANPGDAALKSLRRRLETLSNIIKPAPAAMPSGGSGSSGMMPMGTSSSMQPMAPMMPNSPQNQSLQPPPQGVQNPAAVSMPYMPAVPASGPASGSVPGSATVRPEAAADLAAMEAAVRSGRYRDALVILDRHLAANPQDSSAARMRIRIEQMIKIMDGQR